MEIGLKEKFLLLAIDDKKGGREIRTIFL